MRDWTAVREKMRDLLKSVSLTTKTIVGMPSYERYLEHHRQHHPDEAPMSEGEYYLYALKARYADGKVNRCC